MKDEIKEILECIKDQKRDYVGTNGYLYQDLDRKELNLLLNYITNLQEENKRLKEWKKDLLDENIDLENIRKEAIEFIERYLKLNLDNFDTKDLLLKMKDILKGE